MQVNGINFTVGADPEIFVKDPQGIIKSAFGLVKGTKEDPFKVEKGAVQVDGMALEFNIDPANSLEEFSENLDVVQKQLQDMIGDYEFTDAVSNMFDPDYMETQPDEAKILGCSADYNGYTMGENPPPDANGTLRTVGGHLHLGGFETENEYDINHFGTSARLARLLDEQLGVYSILWDTDDQRRSLYGRAGAFRPKKYGMEYRTLSNKWIFNSKIVQFVYEGARDALERMFDPNYEPHPEIEHIINSSDRGHNFFKKNERADYIRDLMVA